MDNLGHEVPRDPAGLLSSQVAASRTFFLQLAGPWHSPVAVALGGWEQSGVGYAISRRSYPYAVVELIVAGRGRVVLAGKAHRLEAGVCFGTLRHTACVIEADPTAPLEKFFFALGGRGTEEAIRRAGISGTTKRVIALGELRDLAELITREGRRPGPAAKEICGHLAAAWLLKVGEGKVGGRARTRIGGVARENFERCRGLVDRHAGEWRCLADIARGAHLEPSSVCRLFRRFLGVSPHQYLRQRKMALAAEFLLEGSESVQQVAARVGMEDPFHFSRVFRAAHGVPPSAVRALGVAK